MQRLNGRLHPQYVLLQSFAALLVSSSLFGILVLKGNLFQGVIAARVVPFPTGISGMLPLLHYSWQLEE